ncbi:hypothetical protein GCM10009745_57880 [Kribbella yunnanensis]|uniref:Secreted protein n=1 Tax=Kribbella yunnanensis TaxID=190194 RepID=A0ABN2IDF4_9ACTN
MKLRAMSRRLVTAVAAVGLAAASGGVAVGSQRTAAAPAAECQSREQPLGFGLNGVIKITVCPYDANWWEVVVGTKENDAAQPLAGYTRVTGSDGSFYTGVWHGQQGFNEGLQAPQNAPAGTQYCGQFFHQPDRTKPASTIAIPICLNSV